METQEIKLDDKKINIVIKLNGEYPVDIDIDENNNQNNFATYSKVSDVVRSDSVVLRMVNPDEANKVINFINNDPYLSSKARKTNPFLMKSGVVGIASDKKLSYNSTLAYLITKYFKETANYDNVGYNDFKRFSQKYFNDVFINQTKLEDFIYDEDFDILKNYSQVEIQNAMYTLTKGYNYDSNQSLINYICSLNLEPKISNKHI